jgi:cytochrome c-type biogenesis protein CcmF
MKEPVKDDVVDSREFWMLVGSLVLLLSAIVITAITSIPVFNKLFGTKIAPPEDILFAHNQVQVFVAIIIGVLTAIGQYLKYKATPRAQFYKQIKWPLIITIILSAICITFIGILFKEKGAGFLGALYVALVTSLFSIVANTYYLVSIIKGKMKSAGASIAHIGFGLMLLGILISASNKTVLSWNTTGFSPLQVEKDNKTPIGNPMENITLIEGIDTDMGKYMVSYLRDTFDTFENRHFELKFKAKKTDEVFFLYPDVMKNNKMEGFSANPAAKHYLHKDIFSYVTSFQDNNEEDTTRFTPNQIAIGDSIFYSNGYIKLNKVVVNPKTDRPEGSNELALELIVTSKEGIEYVANPSIIIKEMTMESVLDTIKAQNLILSFNKVIDQKKGTLEIGFKEAKTLSKLITIKVYEFPFINILWLGIIVMTIGFFIATWARVKKSKK